MATIDPTQRADIMNDIAAQVSGCILCDLHKTRTRAVPGAGNINTEIMFIGEGPGFNEDKQGLPFVGRSGDYLNKLLKMIGLDREIVFITNVVKCRPPENRDPLPIEITTCKPYLDEQENTIDPLVIVTLGRFSMARYFTNGKITQIHGKPKFENGRAYIPMFHPAAVLRNPTLEPQMEADFRQVLVVLEQVKAMRAGGASAPPPPPAPTIGDKPIPPAANRSDDPTSAKPKNDPPKNDPPTDEKPTQMKLF